MPPLGGTISGQDVERPTTMGDSEQLTLSSQDRASNYNRPPLEELTISSQDFQLEMLPQSLLEYILEKCTDVTNENVQEKAKELFYSLSATQEQCNAIEQTTRKQRDCDIWYKQQQGRLTVSSFHSILSMQYPDKVACKLLEKTDLSHVPANKWGIDHEDDARQEYVAEMSQTHQDFEYATAGLVVNPLFPYLGATPDGFVTCHCCGDGLIEINDLFLLKMFILIP